MCSCTKNSQEVISFASWGSVTEVNIIKQIISEFEQQNPTVKVNFIHIPQNYYQKLHLMFASNTPPDVLFINNLYLPLYSDYLEDLREYVEPDKYYSQAIDGMSYNNKLLGIPRDISNLVFYVNIDKVQLPDEKWTVNNLTEQCKSVDNNSFCLSYEDTLYWVSPYLSYFGGGILNKNSDLIINSEESKQALTFYKDLKTKYHYAPDKSQIGSSTLAQMFLNKQITFYLSGRWIYPKINEKADFNWAVINFPYGKTPQLSDVSGWSIAKSSKHKSTAIKFVQYMASEKTSEYFAKTGLVVPANRNTANKFINKPIHNEKVFCEVIKHSSATPVNKEYYKITDELNKKLDL